VLSASLVGASPAPAPLPNPESPIPGSVDLSPYLTLRLLLGALMDGRRVNFVNALFVE
jgi:hypothetical protein